MKNAHEEHKQLLDEFSIGELRVFGKNIGIKAPTSASKIELIDRILTSYYEGVPVDAETRGRPSDVVRNGVDNEKFSLVEESMIFENNGITDCPNFVFEYGEAEAATKFSFGWISSPFEDFEIVDDDFCEKRALEGYLEISKNGYKVLTPDSLYDMEIPHDLVSGLKLQQYDNLEFDSFFYKPKNENTLLKIKKINGIEVDDERKNDDFLTLIPQYPSKAFELLKDSELINAITCITDIPKGARVLIESTNQNAKIIKELYNSFKAINKKTLVISLDDIMEDGAIIKQEIDTCVVAGINDAPEVKMDKIATLFFRAQKYVEAGQDVVVIVNNYDAIFNALSCLIPDVNDNYLTTIATKFFNLAGSYSNNGTLTIFAILENSNIKLFERLKSCASVIIPKNGWLEKSGLYPAIDFSKITNKHESYYMAQDDLTIVNDIKKLIDEHNQTKNEKLLELLKTNKNRADVLNKLKKI